MDEKPLINKADNRCQKLRWSDFPQKVAIVYQLHIYQVPQNPQNLIIISGPVNLTGLY